MHVWFLIYYLLVSSKRTCNEQILHVIKEEGAFSTMHTLLIYLQTALEDERPVVAGLLLQLDLLVSLSLCLYIIAINHNC